ncbi:MAG: PD-(D/E)XK nuclease family protein [Elusimicrobiales bacterium]|nr:PD-(D/E)XK nuclease family protein [Elusimicrobiales bacterium]
MIFDALELNYSKINAYLSCPLLYKFIYVNRKYTPPTGPSSFGLSLHRAIARYHSGGRTLNDLIVYYQDSWLHQGYETPQQAMEYYRNGEKILEKWYMFHSEETNRILYWEKNFRFDFEKWVIKGTIDRIDIMPSGGADVIDYKTGYEGHTAEQAAGSLQLGIYALAAEEAFGLKPERVTYFILSEPQKISVPFTDEMRSRTLETIRDVGTKIFEYDFTGRGNCIHCPIRNICRESSCKAAEMETIKLRLENNNAYAEKAQSGNSFKFFGISQGDKLRSALNGKEKK